MALLLTGCGREVFTGKEEARGVWMSRFEYANERARGNPEAGKNEIRSVFRKARSAKLNMVFFQVRGNGDAFYDSRYEPWSQMLTDTLGKNPRWDPLQFAVEEAHRQGLELHAWFNTFPIWRGNTPPRETIPRQPSLAHPEWIVCDSSGKPMTSPPTANDYIWASPGNPAARQHILNVVDDIVQKYDVDGIHFDYIRYPEGSPAKGYSRDSVSVARFNSIESNPARLSWDHWQREQVNTFVFDAYNNITARKPWVKMSAAVIGKYMGKGWTSYYAVYQDPRRWMEVGKIDFIVPMVYWEREHPTHPFVPLITEWHDRVAYDRHVIPGLSTSLQNKFGWNELSSEIAEVRSKKLPGVVFFSSGGLAKAWDNLGVSEFPFWAVTPRMAWKDSTIPPSPTIKSIHVDFAGVRIQWEPNLTQRPFSYVIYRSTKPSIPRSEAQSILFLTNRNATEFLDTTIAGSTTPFYYSVAAFDRVGNESDPSPIFNLERSMISQRDTLR
jgi:uncharacterized lipoprotein YddW (UPF0748 family)